MFYIDWDKPINQNNGNQYHHIGICMPFKLHMSITSYSTDAVFHLKWHFELVPNLYRLVLLHFLTKPVLYKYTSTWMYLKSPSFRSCVVEQMLICFAWLISQWVLKAIYFHMTLLMQILPIGQLMNYSWCGVLCIWILHILSLSWRIIDIRHD